MLNFFTTSNGFRSTLPVVSNLTAMNVWDGVCMCFIYASLLEFVCVNYVGRKRPLHNVVYRPGENPVTQVNMTFYKLESKSLWRGFVFSAKVLGRMRMSCICYSQLTTYYLMSRRPRISTLMCRCNMCAKLCTNFNFNLLRVNKFSPSDIAYINIISDFFIWGRQIYIF